MASNSEEEEEKLHGVNIVDVDKWDRRSIDDFFQPIMHIVGRKPIDGVSRGRVKTKGSILTYQYTVDPSKAHCISGSELSSILAALKYWHLQYRRYNMYVKFFNDHHDKTLQEIEAINKLDSETSSVVHHPARLPAGALKEERENYNRSNNAPRLAFSDGSLSIIRGKKYDSQSEANEQETSESCVRRSSDTHQLSSETTFTFPRELGQLENTSSGNNSNAWGRTQEVVEHQQLFPEEDVNRSNNNDPDQDSTTSIHTAIIDMPASSGRARKLTEAVGLNEGLFSIVQKELKKLRSLRNKLFDKKNPPRNSEELVKEIFEGAVVGTGKSHQEILAAAIAHVKNTAEGLMVIDSQKMIDATINFETERHLMVLGSASSHVQTAMHNMIHCENEAWVKWPYNYYYIADIENHFFDEWYEDKPEEKENATARWDLVRELLMITFKLEMDDETLLILGKFPNRLLCENAEKELEMCKEARDTLVELCNETTVHQLRLADRHFLDNFMTVVQNFHDRVRKEFDIA